ncbi:MAG: PQQ-binding-like beta-propeller repeat protein [Proteobacteria bacterium]|nr:PQQ-binding-like beta-propeller repeat protein [Pseudomonadota bacterium]
MRLWHVALLGLGLACGAARAEMFRGEAARDGVYAGKPIAAPVLKWKFKTGGRVIASPVVEGGLLYIGAGDGVFRAIDAKSGALVWKYQTQARIASSAAVVDGVAYVASYDGRLYALDAKTGALRWSFATGGERRFAAPHIHGILPMAETMPDPFDFFMSSPAVVDGRVFVGSGDGNVYALDAKTGTKLWAYQTGNVVHASPAVAKGTVYVGSFDTYFYALDAKTGALKWKFKTGEDAKIHNQEGIASSAAVADGRVFFGCRDSNLYALDAATGKDLWRVNNGGSWVIASPAVRGGIVYAATADTANVFAVDAKSGEELWRFTTFMHWPIFSSPALVGDTAYLGSQTGRLMAVDLKTHAVRWAFDTDGSKANRAALTAPDGAPDYAKVMPENFYDALVVSVDRLMDAGAVLSSPAVADGVVYFGSMDGNVYAVGEKG